LYELEKILKNLSQAQPIPLATFAWWRISGTDTSVFELFSPATRMIDDTAL